MSSNLFSLQVCSCLANISKHAVELAELVVEAEIFPKILYRLKDNDLLVKKYAATCIREIAKQSPDLAKLICNAAGAVAIVNLICFFIIKVFKYPQSSDELKKKAKKALKSILQMCSYLPALSPLISVRIYDFLNNKIIDFFRKPHQKFYIMYSISLPKPYQKIKQQ